MSRRLFGKPAKDLSLAEAALVAGLIRGPLRAVALDELRRARGRAADVVLSADARGGLHQRRSRSARRAAATHPHHAVARARPTRAPDTRRTTCASSSASGWATTIRRTGRCTRRSCPPCRRRRSGRWSQGLQKHRASRACRRALVAIDPETGDIARPRGRARLQRARRSTARCAAAASRARPSSPSSTRRRWSAGCRRCRCSPTCTRSPRPARQEWAPRNASDDSPDSADAARGAARVEQPGRGRAAAADRHGRGARPRRATWGCATCPTCPSLALGTGLVTPLELTAAYAVFPNGGYAVKPRAIVRAWTPTAPSPSRTTVERKRVLSEESGVPGADDAAATSWTTGTASSARSLGLRVPAGGQDGDHQRVQGRVVRRLLDLGGGRGLGRASTSRAHRARRLRGAHRAAHLGRLHAAHRALPARGVRAARRGWRRSSCAGSPTCGRSTDCPTYTEYFKEGDEVPARMCPVHGVASSRRRAARWTACCDLGRRLRDIFK